MTTKKVKPKTQPVISVKSSFEIFDISDLIEQDLPAPIWVLEGVIPEGTTILAGDPKSRKSFFCMQLAAACADGSHFCEDGPKATQTKVMYFALDDPKTRLHSRYIDFSFNFKNKFKDKLKCCMNWCSKEMDQIDELEILFNELPGYDLYIIDILAKVHENNSVNKGGYKSDYELVAAFKELFAKYRKSLVITHHTNRGTGDDWTQRVSGTTGLFGASDNLMLLEVNRKAKTTTLRATGNDMEEIEMSMNFNSSNLMWEIAKPEQKALTEKHSAIALKFADSSGFKAEDISKHFKVKPGTARQHINRLKQYPGLVKQREPGTYVISPDNPYGITKSPILSLHDPSNATVINNIDLDNLTKPIKQKNITRSGDNGNSIHLTGSFARSNEKYMLKYVRTPDDNISISN